ncbi:MAG: phospho-sugar mutase [Verrucomicrobia bacterium]|nr:phospho-sugar mutase [Verrucomicrobiota bacterium]
MSTETGELPKEIRDGVAAGVLRRNAAENIASSLAKSDSQFDAAVVSELLNGAEWQELNDRFYKKLAFGTGGLRGRTIGKIVTRAERGKPTDLGRPEFPCVGTNAMNYENVARATQGLVGYVKQWCEKQGRTGRAKIAIAHDTRHFSNEFANLAAKTAANDGCDAVVFPGPRSTPELSFAVRYLNADAGVVITASHNPPYDNGYKVYFNDGAQVVEPHASGIIGQVNAAGENGAISRGVRGEIRELGDEVDTAYMDRLKTLVLDPELFTKARDLKIVYTPIHGTGSVIIKPMLTRLGIHFVVVPEQDHFDGRFPTVKSPNPENAEALKLGIELALREKADVVIGTDPDCDRMGVAFRTRAGEMKLLSGNQTGSLLTWYRIKTLFDQGILNSGNAAHAVIIKTFVTTDLQKVIADKFGVRCVETLTGFKYIGAKLGKYENKLKMGGEYRQLSERETRQLRLEESAYYIFGGEESYGYSGADFVRDKDGNGATIMFCEVAAYAKASDRTIDELLDLIYSEFGYFEEKSESLVFEGADGAEKIRRLLGSYDEEPPREILGSTVTSMRNFEKQVICDSEGDEVPKEKMLIFELDDKTRIAVRGSGTEPKIKYYLFGQHRPKEGTLSKDELAAAKREVHQRLDVLWDALKKDAHRRLESK